MAVTKMLKNSGEKNFFYLLLIVFFTEASAQIIDIALPLIVYEVTQSAQEMSALRALQFVPDIVLALIIGSLVDAYQKMNGMRISLVGQFVSLLLIAAYFQWFSSANNLILHAIFLMFFTFNFWYQNLRQTSIKLILDKKHLMKANSYISAIDETLVLLGPAMGGLIIAYSAFNNAIFLAVIFLVIAFFITNKLQLNEETTPLALSLESIRTSVMAGLKVFKTNRPLLHLSLYTSVFNASIGVFNIIILFHLRDHLKFNPFSTSIVLAVMGGGGILAAFFTIKLRNLTSISFLLVMSTLISGVLIYVMLLTDNIFIISALVLLFGGMSTIYVICMLTYRYESVDSSVMGRVIALSSALFKLAMPVAIFISGVYSDQVGSKIVLEYVAYTYVGLATIMLLDKKVRGIK